MPENGLGVHNSLAKALPRTSDHPQRRTEQNNGQNVDRDVQDDITSPMDRSHELSPPVLPPRPQLNVNPSSGGAGSLRLSSKTSRPQLQSQATTALSLTGAQTASRAEPVAVDGSPSNQVISRKHSFTHFGRFVSNNESDVDDTASLRSFAPTLDVRSDGESLWGHGSTTEQSGAWKALNAHLSRENPFDTLTSDNDFFGLQIQHEFDAIDDVDPDGMNEEALLGAWKAKLKHFFILSASGKPIYARHGDDKLISHYIGVTQTVISFYQGGNDALRSFSAGETRFVVLSKGPLNLVAISRFGESESQLRNQLESLYMQILSTLTLPVLERMFSNRPSTDLRRPLEGTDVLLDGLADGFTRGLPSTLLSALECLRLRKTDRQAINDALLQVRSSNLLYGMIVAAGRLVSVVRPKKHSLHPGDLHLIFNMLFEAGSIRAGGGENWIPLCLPGFNNTGFLYMYVSFLPADDESAQSQQTNTTDGAKNGDVAIILISANKESFYEMRKMRDDLIRQLEGKGSMSLIKTAIQRGRLACAEIAPETVLEHFLYKSRANVQFTMPSFEPLFHGLVARRKLMSLYSALHESMHNRTSHLRVHHCISEDASALAWETPMFELYCVAGPQVSRQELARGANKVVQWIKREEERVFIIGGAVF